MNLYWIETSNARLAIVGRPRGHDWLDDDITSLKQAGVDVLVSALTASESEELGLVEERNVCRSREMDFVSFPIEDRSVPVSQDEFQRLIVSLHALLAAGKHVAIHCRAGIGRSSLIAAALLVDSGFSVETAFVTVERARGISIPDTPEQRLWLERYSLKSK